MQYRVICGGILKVNGELATYNTVLEEIELDDPTMRVKEGYVEMVKGSDKTAAAKVASAQLPPPPADNSAAINAAVEDALKAANDAKQAEIDAAVQKALADKQAEIDAQKAIDDAAAQKALDDAAANAGGGDDAANLLDKAKNAAK